MHRLLEGTKPPKRTKVDNALVASRFFLRCKACSSRGGFRRDRHGSDRVHQASEFQLPDGRP